VAEAEDAVAEVDRAEVDRAEEGEEDAPGRRPSYTNKNHESEGSDPCGI
jgi:hypothetical protein